MHAVTIAISKFFLWFFIIGLKSPAFVPGTATQCGLFQMYIMGHCVLYHLPKMYFSTCFPHRSVSLRNPTLLLTKIQRFILIVFAIFASRRRTRFYYEKISKNENILCFIADSGSKLAQHISTCNLIVSLTARQQPTHFCCCHCKFCF